MPYFIGTRYTRNFKFLACSNGLPIDITNWQFRGMIRDNRDDPNPLLELTTANGGFLVVDGINGRLQWTISPLQGGTFPVARLMMDVLRTDLVLEGDIWLFEATFQSKLPITRGP